MYSFILQLCLHGRRNTIFKKEEGHLIINEEGTLFILIEEETFLNKIF